MATARPSARLPRSASRAAKTPTSQLTRTSSPRTPSTAPPTRTRRAARAGSAPPWTRQAGSASAGTSRPHPRGSAIIADRDSFQGFRSGNINPVLYLLGSIAPNFYFHDITGVGQSTNNNGFFPTTPRYDEATGLGAPKMTALITES